jgi:3-deoxy-manno-octulosonate cytidylyltransferase (CMP-KDO synthetase)
MTFSDASLRVVIPARYGSSRLPGKPLVDLAGKPMVVRVYEAVRSALPHADTVVAVDDRRILDVMNCCRIPVVMTDMNHESGTDRAAEVAQRLRWRDQDIVINVQGDEPLIPADLLQAFAMFCFRKENFVMGTVAVPIDSSAQVHDPNVVKLTMNAEGEAITFSRWPIPFNRELPFDAWDPGDYLRHIGIYAYRTDALLKITRALPCAIERIEKLEQLRALWLGIPIHVLCWNQSPPQGVDTPQDVARVIAVLNGEK